MEGQALAAPNGAVWTPARVAADWRGRRQRARLWRRGYDVVALPHHQIVHPPLTLYVCPSLQLTLQLEIKHSINLQVMGGARLISVVMYRINHARKRLVMTTHLHFVYF